MSRAREFNTPIDRAVRSAIKRTGTTRARFAQEARLSPSTLMKGRALDPNRGRIHWTSLVMIGAQMGIFLPGETVDENDKRLRKLAPDYMRSSHGPGAARWNEFQGTRLRLVS